MFWLFNVSYNMYDNCISTFTLELIGSNRGNQNVNQQLQNLLQNSNPATTQALLAAIQQQQRSGGNK